MTSIDASIQNLLHIVKPEPALKLVVEAIGILLEQPPDELINKAYRVSEKSVYGATVTRINTSYEDVMKTLNSIDPRTISNDIIEKLYGILDQEEFNVTVAASQGGTAINYLTETFTRLLRKIKSEESRKPPPDSKFLVAVDGSRGSYEAFNVATNLRRFGQLEILCVDSSHLVSPNFSTAYTERDYRTYCQRLGIPNHKWKVIVNWLLVKDGHEALSIVKKAQEHNIDFIVIGSTGQSGPQIHQCGQVAKEIIRLSKIPVIVVPTTYFAVTFHEPATYVVAVDDSKSIEKCMEAALRLMKPSDIVYVLHVQEASTTKERHQTMNDVTVGRLTKRIDEALVEGKVMCLPSAPGSPVAQQIRNFATSKKATYLVFGASEGRGSVYNALLTSIRFINVICK